MGFYEEVLRELIVAVGAALFVGNLWAIVRRRADARAAAARTVARVRPGSPVRPNRRRVADDDVDLGQAPVLRSLTYALIGLVVMIWGIASIVSS